MLLAAPTGVPWDSVFPKGNSPQQQSTQFLLCRQAADEVDAYLNQPLRAVVSTEFIDGPDYWLTVQRNGNTRAMLQRWPIVSLVSASFCPANAFPQVFTTIPLNMMRLEHPFPGRFGTAIPGGEGTGPVTVILAPGFCDWSNGRMGWTLQIQYIAGWPHASLTADAIAGATTISVDDCTGWSLGVAATIFDQEKTEDATSTATSVTAGPGTITLASPLAYEHVASTLISSIPDNILWAATLIAAAHASTRGASGAMRPSAGSPTRAGPTVEAHSQFLRKEAESILAPYKRVY